MTILFAAMHESASGTKLPRANAAACPQLAGADIEAEDQGAGYDPKRSSVSLSCCSSENGFSPYQITHLSR
jgi:hypothetical protein